MAVTQIEPRWGVVCDEYISSGFRTPEIAQQMLERIEKSKVCPHPHRVARVVWRANCEWAEDKTTKEATDGPR